MKFSIPAVLIAVMALAGCMGPEGNPNGQPYANEPGGALAVPPQTMGTVSYDPNVAPAATGDASQSALNPLPPVPMTPSPPR